MSQSITESEECREADDTYACTDCKATLHPCDRHWLVDDQDALCVHCYRKRLDTIGLRHRYPSQPCPWCDGTGGEPMNPCRRCNGNGDIPA